MSVGPGAEQVEGAAEEGGEAERLRQEAARRLERRRRKLLSPEERLARITGQPVAGPGACTTTTASVGAGEDPPLELLTPSSGPGPAREAGPGPDLLSSLLGGGAGGGAPQPGGQQVGQVIWTDLHADVENYEAG